MVWNRTHLVTGRAVRHWHSGCPRHCYEKSLHFRYLMYYLSAHCDRAQNLCWLFYMFVHDFTFPGRNSPWCKLAKIAWVRDRLIGYFGTRLLEATKPCSRWIIANSTFM
ncbi:hypothetical protein TNIN_99031 [Trichonephila inaurata madagascariensis]|uniref:Uncharacterized protein n=1 Tax=Trichonephila inaurata madagascariensis TaxID=2747483 RepID=A0A8X6X4J2_9ARAC|nr:hypothetical protein TNIN_99031 [Trichonephila inaurata madagascariensis]